MFIRKDLGILTIQQMLKIIVNYLSANLQDIRSWKRIHANSFLNQSFKCLGYWGFSFSKDSLNGNQSTTVCIFMF